MTLQPTRPDPGFEPTGERLLPMIAISWTTGLPEITIADVGLIPLSENIHATAPRCAMLAPILHGLVRSDATDRSTTLNNGAADANGR